MLSKFIMSECEELKENQFLQIKEREEAIKKLESSFNILPITINRHKTAYVDFDFREGLICFL